jgi:selenide,water dikinase
MHRLIQICTCILYLANTLCPAAAAAAADESGFLLINEYLQSSGGPPEVFAVGDVASSATHPRPKAGVYAVRQVRHTVAAVVAMAAMVTVAAMAAMTAVAAISASGFSAQLNAQGLRVVGCKCT